MQANEDDVGGRGKGKQKPEMQAVQNTSSDSAPRTMSGDGGSDGAGNGGGAGGGGGLRRKPSVYLGFGSQGDTLKAMPKGNVRARLKAFEGADDDADC